jgi:hypothetical protein
LALDLHYKAERGIPAAVDWLIQLFGTRGAKGAGALAIWRLSVDEEIPIGNHLTLVAFDSRPESRINERILERSQPLYDNCMWLSERRFDKPLAALVREFPNFPYIRPDDTSFQEIERFRREARDLLTLIETLSAGHPSTFGYWFEYENHSLDVASWENTIRWMLPEIVPKILSCISADSAASRRDLSHHRALPEELRSRLLRSMHRYSLSQCHRQMVDRAFDLALAFEIAVSGKGGGEASPGWKVSVRSAQLLGGAPEKRQANREKIGALNRI